MKQPYVGNTKINKLYKGNELWCNWSSGGGDIPVEPTLGYVTDNLMICCDAYGKTSADSFDGFYDTINNKKFNLYSGTANYGTNCVNIDGGYLVYNDSSIVKKSLKNTTLELVFKCGSYTEGWKTIFTVGNYNPSPLSIKANMNAYGGNRLIYAMSGGQDDRKAIRCIDKTKNWNHLIISTDNNNLAKIYINGQYLEDYTLKTYDGDNFYYGSGLYFGYQTAGDVPLMSIGSFRYYNKALTESEILQNYNHEQNITRVTSLNFPALDDSYEVGDPPITDGSGEMSKGGATSE